MTKPDWWYRLISRWARFEVIIAYGRENADGIHSGGYRWCGTFLTRSAAERALRGQRSDPVRESPQQVFLLELHQPNLEPKEVLDELRIA